MKSQISAWSRWGGALRPWRARKSRVPTRFDDPAAGRLDRELFPAERHPEASFFKSAVREIAFDQDYAFSSSLGWRMRVWFEGARDWESVFLKSAPEDAYAIVKWAAKYGLSLCERDGEAQWVAASAQARRLTPELGDLSGYALVRFSAWIVERLSLEPALSERFAPSWDAEASRRARFPDAFEKARLVEEREDLEAAALAAPSRQPRRL